MRKLFLLSPARVSGVRAGHLLNPTATFPLAVKLRTEGLSLSDIFTFASGLYFRGKITYARRFEQGGLTRVITSNAGLADPDCRITAVELRAFGQDDIDAANLRYREPLQRDARALAAELEADGIAVLLGSIATGKYRDILLDAFGDRLVFPRDFVGRGDMSRGGLLLRHAASGIELPYITVRGAVFHGRRAPRIADL